QMEKGEAAPMIAWLLYGELRKAVAENAAPGSGDEYDSPQATAVIEKLLRERPSGWFANYDQLLVENLVRAIDRGQTIQGSRVPRWDWGQYNLLRIPNPVAGRLPLVGKYFNIGPAPMSGSPVSVKQLTQRLGPSLRMVVDFSN